VFRSDHSDPLSNSIFFTTLLALVGFALDTLVGLGGGGDLKFLGTACVFRGLDLGDPLLPASYFLAMGRGASIVSIHPEDGPSTGGVSTLILLSSLLLLLNGGRVTAEVLILH